MRNPSKKDMVAFDGYAQAALNAILSRTKSNPVAIYHVSRKDGGEDYRQQVHEIIKASLGYAIRAMQQRHDMLRRMRARK